MTPIHLNARAVILAAIAAGEAGKLQFQNNPDSARCLYAGPCAIGVSIPEDQREALDSWESPDMWGSGINNLLKYGVVTTTDSAALVALQRAHDSAVCEVYEKTATVANATREFLDSAFRLLSP